MRSAIRTIAAIAVGAASLTAATPAWADGDVTCGAGAKEKWKDERQVRRKAWQRGWEVLDVLVSGDCYEVYARNEQGQSIETFFHPETLDLLVIFRRGKEIFRKEGFTG